MQRRAGPRMRSRVSQSANSCFDRVRGTPSPRPHEQGHSRPPHSHQPNPLPLKHPPSPPLREDGTVVRVTLPRGGKTRDGSRLIVMYVLLRTAERVLCGACMYVYPRGRSNPQGHARGSDLHMGGMQYVIPPTLIPLSPSASTSQPTTTTKPAKPWHLRQRNSHPACGSDATSVVEHRRWQQHALHLH